MVQDCTGILHMAGMRSAFKTVFLAPKEQFGPLGGHLLTYIAPFSALVKSKSKVYSYVFFFTTVHFKGSAELSMQMQWRFPGAPSRKIPRDVTSTGCPRIPKLQSVLLTKFPQQILLEPRVSQIKTIHQKFTIPIHRLCLVKF